MNFRAWRLPENWEWTSIMDLGRVVSGGTPSTKKAEYWHGHINWITPADLSGFGGKYIASGRKSLTSKGLEHSSATLMPAGSVHFSSRAPVGYVVISSESLSTNQGFKSLVPASGVFNEYLYYYLKSAKQTAEQLATGTTFKELSGSSFAKLPVPIAPTNEQERIVTKIEELFSDIDKGVESLTAAREQLKVYRQALLKYAFEGKLTEQWRRDSPDKLEPVEQLLARIKAEREKRYQEQMEEYEKAAEEWGNSGKKDKKPSKPSQLKQLPPLSLKELAELPKLPEGWIWLRFGLLDMELKRGPFGSAITKSMFVSSGFKVYEQGNAIYRDATRGNYFIDNKKYKELAGFAALAGDFIVSCAGTVGKIFELPEDAPVGIINQALMRVRVNEMILSKHFFEKMFESGFFQRRVLSDAKGTAMLNLAGIKELNLVPIAICGLQEQAEVYEILEARLSEVDQLQQTITTSLQQAEALRQSILKEAFSGRLVPQDSDDEPASSLLERIRGERTAALQGIKKNEQKRGMKKIA